MQWPLGAALDTLHTLRATHRQTAAMGSRVVVAPMFLMGRLHLTKETVPASLSDQCAEFLAGELHLVPIDRGKEEN